jgi:hypothetical protein
MISSQRLFKRALAEKLGFIPMGASQQAAGPGGEPVDPNAPPPGAPPGAPMDPAMAGGAPMDPAMAGGAPMDPAMAGAPPMDPAMGGAPPMDPAMGGAPPMDPAMGGMPPMDPSMMDPAMGGMPPPPPEEEPNSSETDVDDNGKADTMVPLEAMKSFTVGVIEAMKGRVTAPAKQEAEKAKADAAAAGGMPGPVTGMPGFDPSMIGGPLKTAAVLSRAFRR